MIFSGEISLNKKLLLHLKFNSTYEHKLNTDIVFKYFLVFREMFSL